jgi:hypothetical protein
MTSAMCNFCKGFGNCVVIQSGKYEWCKCPFCAGYGTRNGQRGESTIKVHAP